MFPIKPLPTEAVEAALERAEHYRLLNEPKLAESICLDVLEVDPDNRRAMVSLLLARSDQFSMEGGARMEEARALLAGLRDEYERHYYAGILCERWATALLARHQPGSGSSAYAWFRKAMSWYEKAEPLRPPGHDDPVLRWNTCARMIMRHDHVRPEHEDDFLPLLE